MCQHMLAILSVRNFNTRDLFSVGISAFFKRHFWDPRFMTIAKYSNVASYYKHVFLIWFFVQTFYSFLLGRDNM